MVAFLNGCAVHEHATRANVYAPATRYSSIRVLIRGWLCLNTPFNRSGGLQPQAVHTTLIAVSPFSNQAQEKGFRETECRPTIFSPSPARTLPVAQFSADGVCRCGGVARLTRTR